MSKAFVDRRFPAAILTKKQILLDLLGVFGTNVVFEAETNEASGLPASQVDFLHEDWVAMGRPEVITITIEPGDLLNA